MCSMGFQGRPGDVLTSGPGKNAHTLQLRREFRTLPAGCLFSIRGQKP